MNRFAKALVISMALLLPVAAMGAEVYKVSDLYKEKGSLDKQKVTVKGKVVKVSSGIMGKNWIHLQDGSGDPGKKTNDLTITTKEKLPAVGKTVTVTGTLYKDKDFGSGYFYSVIVEDAVIK